MAGNTITTMSSLQCPHGGLVTIASSNTRVLAMGAPVATMDDTFTVAGCPFQIPATPPIPSPCVTVRWLEGDEQVQAGGAKTLSSSSVGLCISAQQVPQGPVIIAGGQARVDSR